MAITYTLDAPHGIIHSRFEGDITLEGLKDYNLRLRNDAGFRSGLKELAEVAGIEPRLGASEMTSFGQWFRTLAPLAAVAIVAPGDLAFGMARMFASTLGDGRMRISVFRDIASARRWLEALDAPP